MMIVTYSDHSPLDNGFAYRFMINEENWNSILSEKCQTFGIHEYRIRLSEIQLEESKDVWGWQKDIIFKNFVKRWPYALKCVTSTIPGGYIYLTGADFVVMKSKSPELVDRLHIESEAEMRRPIINSIMEIEV